MWDIELHYGLAIGQHTYGLLVLLPIFPHDDRPGQQQLSLII
jgi:hypothetical protein